MRSNYQQLQDLQELWEKISNGRTPEQFLKEATRNLLKTWLATEKGQGEYQQVGAYWEVLYPILKKYQPELLSQYANLIGEFSEFNPTVKDFIDKKSELYNMLGALQTQKERVENYSLPSDVHLLEIESDKIIPYSPNRSMDSQDYWGRTEQW